MLMNSQLQQERQQRESIPINFHAIIKDLCRYHNAAVQRKCSKKVGLDPETKKPILCGGFGVLRQFKSVR